RREPRLAPVRPADCGRYRRGAVRRSRPGGLSRPGGQAAAFRAGRGAAHARHSPRPARRPGVLGAGHPGAAGGLSPCRAHAAHAYPFAFTNPVAGRRYARRQHEVDYCLDLARVVGADGDAIPRLRPPPAAALPPALVGDTPYLVIHPGASNGAAKRWPAAAWARVARQAVDELGARVAVSGGEGERALVEAVVAAAGPGVVPVVGGSLLELAGLLA